MTASINSISFVFIRNEIDMTEGLDDLFRDMNNCNRDFPGADVGIAELPFSKQLKANLRQYGIDKVRDMCLLRLDDIDHWPSLVLDEFGAFLMQDPNINQHLAFEISDFISKQSALNEVRSMVRKIIREI